MQDVLLLLTTFAVFALLFFVMSRLDRFLSGIRVPKAPEKDDASLSCVLLTEDLDDAEFDREVHRFRQAHKGSAILLSETDDTRDSSAES